MANPASVYCGKLLYLTKGSVYGSSVYQVELFGCPFVYVKGYVVAINRVVRYALKDQVYQMLLEEITSGTLPLGTRLDPIRTLAKRFGTSVRTVHLALTALENQGHLIKKHGSGTFVDRSDPEMTMADTVVMCMSVGGHVFSDLCRMLQQDLGAHKKIPMCLDVNHPDFARVLRRTSLSQADFFIVHGTQYFPFDLLQTKPFAHKTVIGIMDWETEVLANTTHRVLVDHTAGGRQVAKHFRAAGHRRALLAGNGQMLWFAEQDERRFPSSGHGFLEEWGDQTGPVERCIVLESGASVEGPDADHLLALLDGPDAPTAIFALMDANGAWIQSVLLARAPQLFKKIELVGYGNTPWSQAAHPAFSSVDWNLAAVVSETSAIIDAVQAGLVTEPKTVWVQPVFVKR